MHLFCGEVAGTPEQVVYGSAPSPAAAEGAAAVVAPVDVEWREKMEAEITLLKAQVSRLQALVGVTK